MGCIHSTPADFKPGSTATLPDKIAPVKASQGEVAPLSNGNVTKQVVDEAPQQDTGVMKQNAEDEQSSPLMVVWRDVDVPVPLDEQHRWDQLVEYNILDTEPEEAYERITELCKKLFKVPIAMVTFVDKDRVWLKSVQGLPGLKQVERRSSLCAWTLLSRFPEALVVPDLREDVRFKDFPIVAGWPHARFYAACPLVSSNRIRLGTLCILDLKPREFSADNATLLAQLASMVMREVERKRAMNDALCSTAVRHHSGDSIQHDRQGLMLCDMTTPKWAIYLVNDAWQRATGISQEMAAGGHFWDLFEPPAPAQLQACKLATEQRRNFELRIPCSSHAGAGRPHDPLLLQVVNNVSNLCNAVAVSGQNGGGSPGLNPAEHGGMPGVCSSVSTTAPALAEQALSSTSLEGLGVAVAPPCGSKGFVAFSSSSADAPIQPSRRRSIGGGMRYVRFQFRSLSSAASHMMPAVSIPSTLISHDSSHNYYWATVDVPSAASQHGGDEGSHLSVASSLQLPADHSWGPGGRLALNNGALDAASDLAPSHCSSGHTGPSSEVSSSLMHVSMKTTFCLLPEDNPFQDITIGSLLGWGSYGRVHRGYWNGSLVAVKVLEQVPGDFNPRSSLEPLLHHRLSHPNIVAMFDVCTQEVDVCEDGRPLQEVWMVLEFCNRGTLSDAIQRGWLLSVRDGAPVTGQVNLLKALTTAREVAAALEYLHSQNVLHGDLNGNNILLAGAPVAPDSQDQRGFAAKVADFGLSRLLTPDNQQIITRTHGTITHMAPEVITAATHSKAADVYSFGVVLFELLSGTRPYHGMHYAQIVSSITNGKLLQLLPQQMPNAPAELLQLIASCLATQSSERPTFADVHQQLLQLEGAALAGASASGTPILSTVGVTVGAAGAGMEPRAVTAPVAADECLACEQQIRSQVAAALSAPAP